MTPKSRKEVADSDLWNYTHDLPLYSVPPDSRVLVHDESFGLPNATAELSLDGQCYGLFGCSVTWVEVSGKLVTSWHHQSIWIFVSRSLMAVWLIK